MFAFQRKLTSGTRTGLRAAVPILVASLVVALLTSGPVVSVQAAATDGSASAGSLGDPGSTWSILWSGDNAAQLWRMSGNSFVTAAGFNGPGSGWTAEGYDTHPDGTADLLWSKPGIARLWHLNPDGTFLGATNFRMENLSPIAVVALPDGEHTLAWLKVTSSTTYCLSQEFDSAGRHVRQDVSWDGETIGVSGGPWTCFDLKHVHGSGTGVDDGTTTAAFYRENHAVIKTWQEGGPATHMSTSGNGGTTATAFSINSDATYNIAWELPDGRAVIWQHAADGKFLRQIVGLRGPAGMSVTGLDI